MSKLRVVATPPSTWSRLVSDYLQEKRAAGVSPRTVKHYQAVLERVLLPFCAELGISGPSALTSRHLNQLSAGHLDGTGARSGRAISKATLHSYVRAINSFLTWARGEGEGDDARAQLPSASKRVLDTLSRDEIQRMEDAGTTERDKLIVRLLADTGIRLGELRALPASDVRAEAGRNLLRIRGKGDRERLVPITSGLARRLRRFADRGREEASIDRLFLTTRRGRTSGKGSLVKWQRLRVNRCRRAPE